MRRAIAPFLATGVVLSGAAVVVANPVVPLPSDIRVSATDFTPDGQRLDVLDPEFLQSIGAIRQDWLSSVEELQRLFNDVSNTGRDSVISAFGVGVATTEPAVALPVDGFSSPHQRTMVPHTPLPSVAPHEAIEGIVGALTDIGTGFGEAGINFVRQVAAAPAVALVLTQQVVHQLITGQIGPEEALRRLIVDPLTALLTGHPNLTGIEAIDRAFHESALKPLIRALIRNLPKPIGQPGGLIDQVDKTVDDVAVDIRDGLPAASAPGQLTGPSASTGTDQELPPELEGLPDDDGTEPAATPRPGAPRLPKPGDLAREFGVRVQQGLDNFHSTIKRFTTGGRKNAPAADDGKGDGATGGKDDGTVVDKPAEAPGADTQAPDRDDPPADRGDDTQE
ncbi:hypothetical protein [Mycolicibacterium litorale]|uniref:Uncharacterized protein n=1 Tax=Mycolicibacterium litorale TaxID=758802 RepID=A0AAD1IN17_9MYCO|nr:hypothetical protein [Mycolicibacterium litorale]TDY05836.1 hypothetical protein BCL50_2144 [Mycolicibacterium litorale]BBY14658.1 hypothetical protein MLIT_02500 [Mycolicibacterium litorale]